MIIRPARPADVEAVARLWHESWESIGISNETDLGRAELTGRVPGLTEGGRALLVAQADGARVGMLALDPGARVLDQLFVAPARQGEGIGKALLAFARDTMPGEISLRTALENARARAWCESEGFRPVRTYRLEAHRRDVVEMIWTP